MSADLTAGQLRALAAAPIWGPRPGDNLWPLMCLPIPGWRKAKSMSEAVAADGDDIVSLIRSGLLECVEHVSPRETIRHAEYGDVELRWLYSRTPAGTAALAAQEGEKANG